MLVPSVIFHKYVFIVKVSLDNFSKVSLNLGINFNIFSQFVEYEFC